MANVPTTSWDETSPAGSQSILLGDNRIREFKTQVREVIGVDHDFPSSGQAADNGQHLRVTLQEQADLGSGAEGVPILGAQTINSKAELVFTDEDDNDIQITSAGYIDGASVRLDNDESLTATDNAGTGTVSLIKANASDQAEVTPALLADGGVIPPEITAPTTAANQGALYTKNDGTQTELYFREESAGDEVQLTKGGSINAISKIYDYGTSLSSFTEKNKNALIICYGSTSFSASGTKSVSNLPFTSVSSYRVSISSSFGELTTENIRVIQDSASQFTIYDDVPPARECTVNWIAIGT